MKLEETFQPDRAEACENFSIKKLKNKLLPTTLKNVRKVERKEEFVNQLKRLWLQL